MERRMRAGVLIGYSPKHAIGGTVLITSLPGMGQNRTSQAGVIIAMGNLLDKASEVTDNAQTAIAHGVNRR
jgi:hypothetical protein